MNEDELKRLTVRVIAGDGSGSGFFVDSGTVLTCGHVIRDLPPGSSATVVWNKQSYKAEYSSWNWTPATLVARN